MNEDLTLLLGIEARQTASEVIDVVNESVAKFIDWAKKAGTSADEMSAQIDTAFGDPAIVAEMLTAQTARLAGAQADAAGAAETLAKANADAAAGMEGAAAAQATALDELTAAQGRLSKAQGEVALTQDAQKASLAETSGKTDDAASKTGVFSGIMGKVGPMGLIAAAGVAVFAKSSFNAATSYQGTVASIAAGAQISVDSAQKIGNAFLTTAGTTTMSAQQIGSAYAGVAGQLGSLNGGALTATQALGFMRGQAELAEASGQSLGSVTSSTAKLMQAFQIPVKDAAGAQTALYEASRLTGQNFSRVSNQVAMMKSRMGDLSPTIQDTSASMVDLAEHGETGRQAMTVMSTAVNTLLKQSAQTTPTMAQVKKGFDALPQSAKAVAEEILNGSASHKQLATDMGNLTPAVKAEVSQFQSLVTKSKESADTLNALKTTPAQQELSHLGVHVQNAGGQFVGMGSLISQLQPKLEGMSKGQQIAALTALFGQSSAHKLYSTIMAGPAAYSAAMKAVSDHTAITKAAEARTSTFKARQEELKSSFEDTKVALGTALIPIITKLMSTVAETLGPLLHFVTGHKELVAIIAVAIGVVGGLVGGLWIMVKVGKAVSETFNGVSGAIKAVLTRLGLMKAAQEEAAAATEITTVAEDTMAASSDAASLSIDGTAASFLGLDTAMAPFILTVLAIIAIIAVLVFAGYELVTHWKTVWGHIKEWALDAWHFIDNNVIHPIAAAFEDVVKWIQKHWELLVTILSGPFAPILAIIFFFRGTVMKIFDDIVDWVKKNWELLVEIITGPVGWLIAIWQHFHDQIIDFFTSIWHWITNTFDDIRHDAASVVDDIVSFFSSLPGKIINAISTLLDDFLSFGESIVKSIVRGIGNVAGDIGRALMGAVKSGVSAIPLVGGVLAQFLADGGIVTQPTLAVIGEAGPEAVVPLNSSLLLNGGSGGVAPLPTSLSAAGLGNVPTALSTHPQQVIQVYATTNANPYQISSEVAWVMKTVGG